jgi:hypothetical protein
MSTQGWKSLNFVNVVFERPLNKSEFFGFHFVLYSRLLSFKTKVCTAKWIWESSIFYELSHNMTWILGRKLFWTSKQYNFWRKTGKLNALTGENTKVNKQSVAMFWLNWGKYGSVSYSISCTWLLKYTGSNTACVAQTILARQDSSRFEVHIPTYSRA